LREVEALKFIEVTERGRAGNAEYRRPNLFRLTYRPVGRALATDEWRSIKTEAEAKMLSKIARANFKTKHFPVGDRAKSRWDPHRKPKIHSGILPTTGPSGETHTASISVSQRIECAPYVFSTDPRAVSAFGTSEYRGRPFLIVNNDVRKNWPHPVGAGTANVDYGRHETIDRRAGLDGSRGPIWPRCEPRSHARSSLASPLPRLCTRRVSMVRPCKRSKG
jgi:hypothetical protein